MLEKVPSRTVIIICLLIAVGSLFLRNLVYLDHSNSPAVAGENGLRQHSTPIILAYHERPPYYVTGGDNFLTGLVGEPALSAFRNSGLQFVVQKMPSKRQQNSVHNNKERICALGWFKTPEREQFARFTLPLYQDLPTVVITRADLAATLTEPALTELFRRQDLTLLIKSGYSYGAHIDQALQLDPPPVVTTTGNTAQMIAMIGSGKADYFFAAAEEAAEVIAASGSPESYRQVVLVDVPLGNRRYLMCSRQVRPEEIERLNQAIAARTGRERTTVRSR